MFKNKHVSTYIPEGSFRVGRWIPKLPAFPYDNRDPPVSLYDDFVLPGNTVLLAKALTFSKASHRQEKFIN